MNWIVGVGVKLRIERNYSNLKIMNKIMNTCIKLLVVCWASSSLFGCGGGGSSSPPGDDNIADSQMDSGSGTNNGSSDVSDDGLLPEEYAFLFNGQNFDSRQTKWSCEAEDRRNGFIFLYDDGTGYVSGTIAARDDADHHEDVRRGQHRDMRFTWSSLSTFGQVELSTIPALGPYESGRIIISEYVGDSRFRGFLLYNYSEGFVNTLTVRVDDLECVKELEEDSSLQLIGPQRRDVLLPGVEDLRALLVNGDGSDNMESYWNCGRDWYFFNSSPAGRYFLFEDMVWQTGIRLVDVPNSANTFPSDLEQDIFNWRGVSENEFLYFKRNQVQDVRTFVGGVDSAVINGENCAKVEMNDNCDFFGPYQNIWAACN